MGDGGAAGAGGAAEAAARAGGVAILHGSFRESLFRARQAYIDTLNEMLPFYKAEYDKEKAAGEEEAKANAQENYIGVSDGINDMNYKNKELIGPPGLSDMVKDAMFTEHLASGNMLKEADEALSSARKQLHMQQTSQWAKYTSDIRVEWRIKVAEQEHSIIKFLTEQARGIYGAQGGRRRVKKSKKRRRSHKTKKSA